MSSIESSNQSLNNILDKIGVRSPGARLKESSLGQEDFLKLMTTQLQNQDPSLLWKWRIYCPNGTVFHRNWNNRDGSNTQGVIG